MSAEVPEEAVEAAVDALLQSDAMTGDSYGTPSTYFVEPENVEYLVGIVLAAAVPALTAQAEAEVERSVAISNNATMRAVRSEARSEAAEAKVARARALIGEIGYGHDWDDIDPGDLLAALSDPTPTAHEFDEDVDDASMCVCGVPALVHDAVYPTPTTCTCTQIAPQTLQEPADWEQADDCPVHPMHPTPTTEEKK